MYNTYMCKVKKLKLSVRSLEIELSPDFLKSKFEYFMSCPNWTLH